MVAVEVDKQQLAIELVQKGENLFVTGSAGVGKSWVIQQLTDDDTILCAPTGIAALNIGGSTCHSTFGLPIGIPTDADEFMIPKAVRDRFSAYNLKRIIIDECFKGDVEILTEDGFIRFDELENHSVRVAQVDQATKEISFCQPTRKIKNEFDGEMVRLFSDNKIDITCTKGHEILQYESDGGSPYKIKAGDFKASSRAKMLSAGYATGAEKQLTLYEKLSIAFQADGSTHVPTYSNKLKDVRMTEKRYGFTPKKDHGSMSFYFKKERKIDRFRYEFQTIINNETDSSGYKMFSVNNVPSTFISKSFWDMFDITTFSKEKAVEFIEFMSVWDGNVNKCGGITYSNTNKSSVDFVQCVAVLAGYKASVSKITDHRKDTFSDCYKVYITPSSNSITCQRIQKEVCDHKGYVYCVTVPKSNIIVRSGRQVHVIGNCGMLRADYLDLIDRRLKNITGVRNKPFGGIQMILVGDFCQLEPIVSGREKKHFFEEYSTPFAFGAACWRGLKSVELTEVKRQSNKTQIAVLNSIRKGDYRSQAALQKIRQHASKYENKEDTLHLCCYKGDAEIINRHWYNLNTNPVTTYFSEQQGSWKPNEMPVDDALELKVGVSVLICANSPDGAYINGNRGVVKALYDDKVLVTLDSGEDALVEAFTWSKYRYNKTDDGKLKKEVDAEFRQIPIRLGYAISVHRAQGMTLDEAAIDIGRGCFAHGQLYMALSRVRDLKNISFLRPVAYRNLIIREEVIEFYEQLSAD